MIIACGFILGPTTVGDFHSSISPGFERYLVDRMMGVWHHTYKVNIFVIKKERTNES